jgi:hypothetical protein
MKKKKGPQMVGSGYYVNSLIVGNEREVGIMSISIMELRRKTIDF